MKPIAFAAALAFLSSPVFAQKAPNILLILTDDRGWGQFPIPPDCSRYENASTSQQRTHFSPTG